jgi:hypothetical protein
MSWSKMSDKEIIGEIIKALAVAGAYTYEIERRAWGPGGLSPESAEKELRLGLDIHNALATAAEQLTFDEMGDVWNQLDERIRGFAEVAFQANGWMN